MCPTLCEVLNIGHLGLSSQAYPRGQLSGLAPFHREKAWLRKVASPTCSPSWRVVGKDLNPESLAHKWGKDEGVWMQVVDSAGA